VTNVNTTLVKMPGLTNKNGDKKGYFLAKAKAAQNDTITIKGIKQLIKVSSLTDDTTGAWETFTVSGAVITLTSATTGAKSGEVIYR